MTPQIPKPMFDAADLKLWAEQLTSENETISFLLKTHLLSEHYLDRLLANYLGEKRELLEQLDLRFKKKLSLVDAFALLPKNVIRSLDKLNKLRNTCAHTLNTRPSLEDVRLVAAEIGAFPGAESVDNVPDFLKAYMSSLFGYLSPACKLSKPS